MNPYRTVHKDEESFLFYAAESPAFPSRMLGGAFILDDSHPELLIRGSAFLIAGGEIARAPHKAESTVKLSTLCWTDGGISCAESIVTKATKPDDHIIIFHDDPHTRNSEHTKVGLEAIRAADGTVYTGRGDSLPHIHWLEGANAVSCSCVIASTEETELGSRIIETAKSHGNVRDILIDFTHRYYTDPEAVYRELEGYSLYAGMGGLDTENVLINMSSTETERMRSILRQTAEETGMILFDAGTIAGLEANPPDYYGRTAWQPLPTEWKRIA